VRILHVITGLDTGGAETMLLKLLTAHASAGVDCAVVSLGGEGTLGPRIAALGIPVVGLGISRRMPNPAALLTLLRFVRRFDPQLVQGWMYHGNLAASLAGLGSRRRVPVNWSIRQSLYDLAAERRTTAILIRLGARLSRRPAAIIYNSETSAGQHQALGYAAANRLVIPNGFDCDVFRPSDAARQRVRGALGIAEDAIVIGLIARWHPMKDHRTFLEAAALVARSHPSARLLLAGRGISAEEPALMGLVAEHGLLPRVLLLGERADVRELTAALDIACSASAWGEGFANVIGEAMASGVPCVVTDVGDSARIVGATGIVVPARTPAALAEAIRTLIDAGPERRRELGVAARRRVETEFSLPAIAGRYLALYRQQVADATG
jgi:glycosyltransferase involved in cell wall biosynthesis